MAQVNAAKRTMVDYSNYPIRVYRVKPNAERMSPPLLAIGHAAGQMPKLRRMSIEVPFPWPAEVGNCNVSTTRLEKTHEHPIF